MMQTPMAIFCGNSFKLARIYVYGLCLLLGSLFPAQVLVAENSAEIESLVKAAYVYKFGNYVVWPETVFAHPDSKIVIAVAADDKIADALVQEAGARKIAMRPVLVRRVQHGDSLIGVHILFVGKNENQQLVDWLAQTHGLPVLTITEAEDGLAYGSIINFVVDDNRVRFDVSPANAQRNRLRLDAALMSVARQVQGRVP